jgi:phospholipase/lecithinase/hemolysin
MLDFGAASVLVANVPDLAALPAIQAYARASGDPAYVLARASAVADAFNRELAAELDDVEAGRPALPGQARVIVRFDLHAALAAARQALAANGANALDACFDTELYRDSAAARRAFHADCAPDAAGGAPRFADFVFFDGIHPTGAAHAAIGDSLRTLF